jgi:hypothetical protein
LAVGGFRGGAPHSFRIEISTRSRDHRRRRRRRRKRKKRMILGCAVHPRSATRALPGRVVRGFLYRDEGFILTKVRSL